MPGRITALINQAEKIYSRVGDIRNQADEVHGRIGTIIADMKAARASMPAGRYSERVKRENKIREATWLYECEKFLQADVDKLCETLRDGTGDD